MLTLLVARGLSRGDWFEFGLSRRISVACSGFAMAMPARNRGLRPKRRGAVFLREPSRRNPQRDRYGRLLTHARLSKTRRTPAPVPKAEGRPRRRRVVSGKHSHDITGLCPPRAPNRRLRREQPGSLDENGEETRMAHATGNGGDHAFTGSIAEL